jgi:hypothetical protein
VSVTTPVTTCPHVKACAGVVKISAAASTIQAPSGPRTVPASAVRNEFGMIFLQLECCLLPSARGVADFDRGCLSALDLRLAPILPDFLFKIGLGRD